MSMSKQRAHARGREREREREKEIEGGRERMEKKHLVILTVVSITSMGIVQGEHTNADRKQITQRVIVFHLFNTLQVVYLYFER